MEVSFHLQTIILLRSLFQASASGRAVAAVLLRVRAHRHHPSPRESIARSYLSHISPHRTVLTSGYTDPKWSAGSPGPLKFETNLEVVGGLWVQLPLPSWLHLHKKRPRNCMMVWGYLLPNGNKHYIKNTQSVKTPSFNLMVELISHPNYVCKHRDVRK